MHSRPSAEGHSRREIDFEKGLKELEKIVGTLEEGNVSLDRALSLYEEGMKLSRALSGLLSQAEKRITRLRKMGEKYELEPLALSEDEEGGAFSEDR